MTVRFSVWLFSIPGGMLGNFPGEMPGMGGHAWNAGKPRLNEISSDPEVLHCRHAGSRSYGGLQDVTQTTANMSKYQSNPKVRNFISKFSAKFGDQA